MIWKQGVESGGLHPEMSAVLDILDATRQEALTRCAPGQAIITAGKESGHSAHSLHHDGLALDVRTKDVAQVWAGILEERLGVGWDVVVEVDHIHIERDPKKRPLATRSDSGEATGTTRDNPVKGG